MEYFLLLKMIVVESAEHIYKTLKRVSRLMDSHNSKPYLLRFWLLVFAYFCQLVFGPFLTTCKIVGTIQMPGKRALSTEKKIVQDVKPSDFNIFSELYFSTELKELLAFGFEQS